MQRDRIVPWTGLPGLPVAATAAVYAQTQGFDFISYDDDRYIVNNFAIQAGLNAESLRWAFSTGYEGAWQPLVWLSFMLDFQIAGRGTDRRGPNTTP